VISAFIKWSKGTHEWLREDYRSNKLRFILEIMSWAMSIGCATIMAFTLPDPPFFILYPLFIIQCAVYSWSSWTRGSFGMLANYFLLMSIDTVAVIRLVLKTL